MQVQILTSPFINCVILDKFFNVPLNINKNLFFNNTTGLFKGKMIFIAELMINS